MRIQVNYSGRLQLGSACLQTLRADAFGEQGTFDAPFGFAGEPYDQNGLTHLRARYYDGQLGRFFNQDPSRQDDNLYAYVNLNPVNLTDPSGLCPESPGAFDIVNALVPKHR